MCSGRYKNSHRELRPSFMRSYILVNKCWPLDQHFNCLVDYVCVKNVYGQVWKWDFAYIEWCGLIYEIWGLYMIGNRSSNIVLTFPNVSEPYERVYTKISKNYYFCTKNDQFLPFFVHKMLIFRNFGLNTFVWSWYVRES